MSLETLALSLGCRGAVLFMTPNEITKMDAALARIADPLAREKRRLELEEDYQLHLIRKGVALSSDCVPTNHRQVIRVPRG